MKTICFYISDYGYGHAARAIALIREITARYNDIRIIVKTKGPYVFSKRSLLTPHVIVVKCQNDISLFHQQGADTIDREKTVTAFLQWMNSWKVYISSEYEYCKAYKVDLIISDIAPQPFCVAEALGIPSIAISNFSWDTIYGYLFPELAEIEILRQAYQKASHACILPFDIGMEAFLTKTKVGLVSRNIMIPRSVMRQRNGIGEDEIVVYVGRIPHPNVFSVPDTTRGSGIRFLVPSGELSTDLSVITIPHEETESQNWLAMCDVIIAKCGYSTVSEAVRARVPLIVWKRNGFIEDDAIAKKIESCGIGITVENYQQGISLYLDNRSLFKNVQQRFGILDDQISRDGAGDVCHVIEQTIRLPSAGRTPEY
jgi:uncharacterized protein (TIGR00661 family)